MAAITAEPVTPAQKGNRKPTKNLLFEPFSRRVSREAKSRREYAKHDEYTSAVYDFAVAATNFILGHSRKSRIMAQQESGLASAHFLFHAIQGTAFTANRNLKTPL